MNIRGTSINYWPWPQEKPFDSGYYGWSALYNTVYLESDGGKMHRRIAEVYSVMQTRLQELERCAEVSSEARVIRKALRTLRRKALRSNLNHKTKTKILHQIQTH